MRNGLRTPSKKFLIQPLDGFRWQGAWLTFDFTGLELLYAQDPVQ
jgi:hypothetical protein